MTTMTLTIHSEICMFVEIMRQLNFFVVTSTATEMGFIWLFRKCVRWRKGTCRS